MNTETLKKLRANATPAPWTFYADLPSTEPDWHIVTTANRMRVLANVHIEPGNAMDNANARLIALAPQLAADNIALQAEVEAFRAGVRKVLPLMEAASREEVTDCTDWDEADAMLRAALNGSEKANDA